MNIHGPRLDDGLGLRVTNTRRPLLAHISDDLQLREVATDRYFERSEREPQDQLRIKEVSRRLPMLGMAVLIASPVYTLVFGQLCDPVSPLTPSGNGCVYDADVRYIGGADIPLKSYLNGTIHTPDMCCQLCQTTKHANGSSYCLFFTHDAQQHSCSLKSNIDRVSTQEAKAFTSGACVKSKQETWGDLGIAIVRVVVLQRILPVMFTIILWGAYFGHLQFDKQVNRWRSRYDKDYAVIFSKRWIKISIFISCAFLFCQSAEHIAYEEYGQRGDAILLHRYPDEHHSNFAYPTGYAHQTVQWESYFYYLAFIDLVLAAANTFVLLVGIDAVCSRFTNVCEQVDEAASKFSRGILSTDPTDGEAADEEYADPTTDITNEQSLLRLENAVQKLVWYRGNVLFAAIMAELIIVIGNAVFYIFEAIKSFSYSVRLPTKMRWDVNDLWECEDWDMQLKSDGARCAIVWTIFSCNIISWALVVPVYIRGLRVALKYNEAINDLLDTRATCQGGDHKLLHYLAALNRWVNSTSRHLESN
jgi:hypothetical protein